MSPNEKKCRIIVDAMGGDYIPENPILGTIEALKENSSFDLYLLGNENQITDFLKHKE
jgi:glycerol-3-phosphate acyltransferase PlsX